MRVTSRSRDEGAHRRPERLVGKVDEHIALADAIEDRFAVHKLREDRLGRRLPLAVQEVGQGEHCQQCETCEVEQAGVGVHLIAADPHLFHEEVEYRFGHGLVDLEPNELARPMPSLQQLLDRLEQVVSLLLFDGLICAA